MNYKKLFHLFWGLDFIPTKMLMFIRKKIEKQEIKKI